MIQIEQRLLPPIRCTDLALAVRMLLQLRTDYDPQVTLEGVPVITLHRCPRPGRNETTAFEAHTIEARAALAYGQALRRLERASDDGERPATARLAETTQ